VEALVEILREIWGRRWPWAMTPRMGSAPGWHRPHGQFHQCLPSECVGLQSDGHLPAHFGKSPADLRERAGHWRRAFIMARAVAV